MLLILLIIASLSLAVNLLAMWRIMPRRQQHSSSVLLDTSALMDGRVLEVVKSGFVPNLLLIPRFVIAELQLLADKADHTKRERARYGLQIVQDLQDTKYVHVEISSYDAKQHVGVDEKLIAVALKTGAMLYTTDYNLLKVAEIEGVRVLNINQLAQNIRSSFLPGERASIKIVQRGQEHSQGVGYTEDGSMVVVDQAGGSIGKTMEVEFTRVLQTAAGRMMFARKLSQKNNDTKSKKSINRSKRTS